MSRGDEESIKAELTFIFSANLQHRHNKKVLSIYFFFTVLLNTFCVLRTFIWPGNIAVTRSFPVPEALTPDERLKM